MCKHLKSNISSCVLFLLSCDNAVLVIQLDLGTKNSWFFHFIRQPGSSQFDSAYQPSAAG